MQRGIGVSNKVPIKNIIFDIGNVMVKWSPVDIIKLSFGKDSDIEYHLKNLFKHDTWIQLNLGMLSEEQAIKKYCDLFSYTREEMLMFFSNIKTTQDLIDGSVDLLITLHQKNYNLYALSDNIREIVSYLKNKYYFWKYFSGVIISAEINLMKPSHDIFNFLLNKYHLNPNETLFIDDHLPNVNAARELDIRSIQFINIVQCIDELRELHIEI